ncbi:MAG: M1 family metallopeptidase [Bacteroidetes bacterium]|nr:M1 family metallopeptidase [Bacteroidota bacterium]
MLLTHKPQSPIIPVRHKFLCKPTSQTTPTHRPNGQEILVYTNNSPNTLTEAYFHLYQNAVQPGSLTDELYKQNKAKVTFGKYEAQKLGTVIHSIQINPEDNPIRDEPRESQNIAFEIQNTLLKIKLPTPLKPGDSIAFHIDFTTYFDRGSIRRRMKVYDHHGYKHFNGVHWYPRICVYDRKFTWETDQHVEKEFYGDYGFFNISLTLPNHYVVEATGTLVNKDDVLPAALRKQLDIANFKDKPIGSQPSVITEPNGSFKTWNFQAVNVHDFAWTADPTYRIGETTWNGVQCVAIAQENNAAGWQQTAQFTAKVIATYSRDFGMYNYPKIVCADAADGMEYPMITLDGGYYPSHQGLIAHEVGHNWFFGMVGSNETYRAALDEGFTQFLTAWCMRKLTKESQPELKRAFAGYMEDAIDGTDEVLETHSNDFHSATGHGGGYKHVYYKTASMLYNLQYYLGDSVFLQAMKNYVEQWKFCHPYIEDFRNSIIQSAQTDLNTFFDQWFQTNKSADYSIKRITPLKTPNYYRVTLQRNGKMVMPVDLDFLISPSATPTTANGNASNSKNRNNRNVSPSDVFYSITIPVSQYQKPGRYNLKPWIGWDKLRPTYTFDIEMPVDGKVKQVWLDRSGRLADINRVNNVWKKRSEWRLDLGNGANTNYLGVYQGLVRPAVRYNVASGVLLGAVASGQYAGRKKEFNLGLWYTSGWQARYSHAPKLQYQAEFKHQTRGGGTYYYQSLLYNEINTHELGWFNRIGKTEYGLNGKSMQRYHRLQYNIDQPFYNPWINSQVSGRDPYFPQRDQLDGFLSTANQWSYVAQAQLNLYVKQAYSGWGKSGSVRFDMRMPSPWSNSQYGFVQLEWKHFQPVGKTLLRLRSLAYFGGGNNPTPESVLYLASANPEDAFQQDLYRDFGMYNLNNSSTQWNTIQVNGGLNLRGFNGYSAPKTVKQANGNDTTLAFFRGNQGLGINAALDLTPYFRWIPKVKLLGINPYLFGDAGIIGQPLNSLNTNREMVTSQVYSRLLADAGFGASVNLRNWSTITKNKALRAAKPINLRVDFPIWVNAVQNDDSFVQFRMRVSVGTDF